MRKVPPEQGEFQRQFHQRWSVLRDPHVRALAWLLDAPDLLDAKAICWEVHVVQLERVDEALTSWLLQLDAAPQALHSAVNKQASTRLGRYAEKLLSFYLQHTNRLVAHNVQIHTAWNQTVGEFDFLLRDAVDSEKILHWEFATKFYLLAFTDKGASTEAMDAFVGPNLADSLAAKLQKIMKQQLMLSSHPAAQGLLWKVYAAQALVKGWVFYPDAVFSSGAAPATISGISVNHCRGFWRSLSDLMAQSEQPDSDHEDHDVPSVHYVIMSRLSWLAPLRCERQQTLSLLELCEALAQHFSTHSEPVLIAVCTEEPLTNANDSQEAIMLERQRGFIVPDDWWGRAQAYVLGRRADSVS